MLAIKVHRDYYRERYGITRPEMIACVTAHAAVDKGCDMLGEWRPSYSLHLSPWAAPAPCFSTLLYCLG